MQISKTGCIVAKKPESVTFLQQLKQIEIDRRRAAELEQMIDAKVDLAMRRLLL